MATEEQIIQAIRLAVSSTMQAMISDLPALRSGAVKGDVEQIVKRIDTFKGENLQHWKFRLEMAVQATNLTGCQYLQWAATHEESIDN